MFGTRRLAKRSIVGTRVAAKWQDGRYYPGVIRSQYAEETPFTDAVYTVLFEDGYEKNIPTKSIVGPGFQASATTTLKNGQKVFLTLNGREVTGLVLQHSSETDDVTVSVMLQSGEELHLDKRLDELRFLKSRKSARLQDQDTDYSKMADLQLSDPKKRTVSSGIDVPSKHSIVADTLIYGTPEANRVDPDETAPTGAVSSGSTLFANTSNHVTMRRHWHSGVGDVSGHDDAGVVADSGEDVEMMDENIAALVLTSLSCSPQSPAHTDMPAFMKPNQNGHQLSTSASSSGYHSNHSERSEPSPPSLSHLSESAPARTGGLLFGPPLQAVPSLLQDEGLELEEETTTDNNKVEKRTMYQCIWPQCGKISSTSPAIEKHVRDVHLGERSMDSGSESDSEVDFYCTEIEVNVDTVTQGFSHMCTSQASPPDPAPSSTPGSSTASSNPAEHHVTVIPDHDYQKKEFRYTPGSSVPNAAAFMYHAQAIPIPVKPAEIQRSLSWQNHTTFSSSPSPPMRAGSKPSTLERLQQHQAHSPKIHSSTGPAKMFSVHKKARSEVRKCRKVYGMENRDMWCTQCKWKKACTRFLD